MNRDEAKQLLRFHSSSDPDRNDPQIAEALDLARQDAELARWLEEEQTSDSAVASRLAAVRPPADLRGKILARSTPQRLTPAHVSWRRRVFVLVAALALLASAAVFWTLNPPSDPFAYWQSGSLTLLDSMLSGKTKFDHESPESSELREWLRKADAPNPAHLPKSLKSLASIGCKTVMLGNNRVSIICFHINDVQMAHLVTTEEQGLAHPPPERQPQFARRGEWVTASWSDGGQSFMLAVKGSEPDLRNLLTANS